MTLLLGLQYGKKQKQKPPAELVSLWLDSLIRIALLRKQSLPPKQTPAYIMRAAESAEILANHCAKEICTNSEGNKILKWINKILIAVTSD